MHERTLKVLEFDKIIRILANMTTSVLGREIAEQLLPETDQHRIKEMLDETDDAVSYILRKGNPPLGGIHDIRSSLKRLELGGVLNPGELLGIGDTLRACRNLKAYNGTGERDKDFNPDSIINKLISGLVTNKRLEDRIEMSIINDEELSDEASPLLGNIRRQIRDKQNSIKDRLNELIKSSSYQKYLQDAIVTVRGDRYVIPVKQEFRNEVPGIVHDMSSSGATIFIEPMSVVNANNDIRQLRIKEQAEIERILRELTDDVRNITDLLLSSVHLLARLDFIFAKGRMSLEYNCVCPRLNTEGRIIIKKGRHPLLDKKTVVPINFWVGDSISTIVITGPNTGGKTVTLKTVGLFVLMTQAGLHVPANDGTVMGIFGHVFADIGDEQSIEQSLSTFSSHMTNIVQILDEADEKSLVLFDELGAGTDPSEGAALAMAILEHLRQIRATVVATTHYSELKLYAISTPGVENASCEFDVQTLRPTYNLLIGVPGKSNAFAISRRLGLSEEILKKAKEFLSSENIQFEDILMSMEEDRQKTLAERMKTESYRIEIEKLKDEMERQKKKFEAEKEKLLREAREEAKKILISAKEQSQEILERLRNLERETEIAKKNKEAEELRLKLKNELDKLDQALAVPLIPIEENAKAPENLKPGDSVLILHLNQKGIVISPPDKDGEVIVQAGIMKINVHISTLKLIDEQKSQVHKVGSGKISMSKAMAAVTEIDLRGTTVDEACELIDKFLDDASIAGLKEITIIHGKGTGALRKGIHQFLKGHPHVKSFRLGSYGEGEMGVTIAEIK
ncbi:MAG TPA: endonuclease MutS2 [Clostridiaceae bacterium]|nr:endonuclease MutS2 [Clostridiaceae bacterium]